MLANHWTNSHAASKKVADGGSVVRWEILVIDWYVKNAVHRCYLYYDHKRVK